MIVLVSIALFVVMTIGRLVGVTAALWIGATMAAVTFTFAEFLGAAVAIVLAHTVLTFEVKLKIERGSRW